MMPRLLMLLGFDSLLVDE